MARTKTNKPNKNAVPLKSPTARKKSNKITAGAADSVAIRMYTHGFGDCFLLTFLQEDQPVYRMLIDCGMLKGDSEPLKKVIADIKETCSDRGQLDLLVQTHEHKDHISGFNLRENGVWLWDDIKVGQVWLAWTENTGEDGDDLANSLKEKHNKKKVALANALGLYQKLISKEDYRNMLNKEHRGDEYLAAQERYAAALGHILGFFDMDPAEPKDPLQDLHLNGLGLTMKDAMHYFKKRRKEHGSPDIVFWNPGDLANASNTALEGVNFYFLGPPKDYNKLRMMEGHAHDEMYLSDMGLTDNFYMALSNGNGLVSTNGKENREGELSPFSSQYIWKKQDREAFDQEDKDHIVRLYQDHPWRSIEADWLHNAGALALHLDSYTNNTSLVIAIEFEKSGKVLLFPADAQIGNWVSWTDPSSKEGKQYNLEWEVSREDGKETVTAANLLARTVFYKVGHHGSHNATARKQGLELMTSRDLVAMIPVDEKVAMKQGKRGWKMPAAKLYERLLQKTKGRIIRLDQGNILENGINDLPEGAKPTRQQLEAFTNSITASDQEIVSSEGDTRPLYYEYLLKG
jgi:hypothetical protein